MPLEQVLEVRQGTQPGVCVRMSDFSTPFRSIVTLGLICLSWTVSGCGDAPPATPAADRPPEARPPTADPVAPPASEPDVDPPATDLGIPMESMFRDGVAGGPSLRALIGMDEAEVREALREFTVSEFTVSQDDIRMPSGRTTRHTMEVQLRPMRGGTEPVRITLRFTADPGRVNSIWVDWEVLEGHEDFERHRSHLGAQLHRFSRPGSGQVTRYAGPPCTKLYESEPFSGSVATSLVLDAETVLVRPDPSSLAVEEWPNECRRQVEEK